MTAKDSLTLRCATAEDAEFAFQVLKETMREYVVATWGTWWEEESRRETVDQVWEGLDVSHQLLLYCAAQEHIAHVTAADGRRPACNETIRRRRVHALFAFLRVRP